MLLYRITSSKQSLITRTGRLVTAAFKSYGGSATQFAPRIVIPEDDIEESFLKGSGPGGQKINKTSSAVQLKHIPTGMVVKSQATRSRSQNRSIARRLLADKLEDAEKGSESRKALKADIKRKKKASKTKKSRRKHRTEDDPRDRVELPANEGNVNKRVETAPVEDRETEA
ncbi:MAG: hypothetical protein Q9209_003225 [Squamulea sp. 1 TL-2023]